MEIPRFIGVILMVLEWTRPSQPSPLRPICDPRVLDRFIKEARDTEVAMRSCKEGCSLADPLTVPLTSVDFSLWMKKDTQEQAQEVQSGLLLLAEAISTAKGSVNSQTLQSLLDNNYSNIYSIRQVIRSLNFQDYIPVAGDTGHLNSWRVSSVVELVQVHTNFLRGKVRLLLSRATACHQDLS